MRIRKHAARILSSLSISTQSFTADAAAAAGGRELEMHVCELNQSPWDAIAFTPLRSTPLDTYQELEELGEDNGFSWSGHTEEKAAAAAAATVSDVSGITSTAESTWRRQVKVEVMAEEQAAEEGEIKRERKKEYAKKRNTTGNSNTKKTKRKNTSSRAAGASGNEKVKMEVESPPTAAAASACKKSDGKGWHCKRAAQHPHSLCEYHLIQVRSYYGNAASAGHALQRRQQQQQEQSLSKEQNAALIPDNKKNKKTTTATKKGSSDGAAGRTRRKPESDFFYYYSGFGPWRGKRRSGGGGRDGGYRGIPSNVDASDGDDERDDVAPRDGAPSPMVHDQGPDDLDNGDDEDMDGSDGAVGCYGGDDVAAGRRRGRKPIKARSLKSLL